MSSNKLGFLNIAFMYVAIIMGAGFASGREIWQFFGVFGNFGYVGLVVVVAMFMLVGFMASRIARVIDSSDMGKVVVPGQNRFLENFVAQFMAIMLYAAIVTMSAAGGALFNQQFGQSRVLGGAVIIFLVTITVIGGFERLSVTFRFIMPVLMIVVILTGLIVIIQNGGVPKTAETFEPSLLAPNWPLAALLYLSYNVIGVIPIMAASAINAKSGKHAYFGSALGGFFLGVLAFIILFAIMTDPALSNSADMPMLALSAKLPAAFNAFYVCALFFAIYASATSCYYGFTTKIIKEPHRKAKITIGAVIGFALGLVGFTNIVAYVFPIEGFLGFSILLMIFVKYILLDYVHKKI